MKIALLLPSRERLDRKFKLISSIIATADNIENISLYLGTDEDDPTRDITLKITKAIPFVKFVNLEKTPNEKANIHKMWNKCASESTEEIIAMIGDDMLFLTKGWDTAIINEFNDLNCPSDKIKLVYCNDGHRPGDLCVNAFVHRNYIKYNGYGKFLREEFIANWVDNWLQQVFTALGRIKYLNNHIILHDHWVFKSDRPNDETGKRLLERNIDKSQSDLLWEPLEPTRVEEVIKLAKLINTQPNWQAAKFNKKYWDIKI